MAIVPLLEQTIPECIFSVGAEISKILRKMNIVKSNVIGTAPAKAIRSITQKIFAMFTQPLIVDTTASMIVQRKKENPER